MIHNFYLCDCELCSNLRARMNAAQQSNTGAVVEVKVDTQPTLDGKKNDQGKPMMALLTPEFLEETAKVLTFGAAKYEKYNWAKGMSWSRPFGALMRHAWAWWGGQDKDPETGLSHLAHCACNILFLLHYEKFKRGEDDRYVIKLPL